MVGQKPAHSATAKWKSKMTVRESNYQKSICKLQKRLLLKLPCTGNIPPTGEGLSRCQRKDTCRAAKTPQQIGCIIQTR